MSIFENLENLNVSEECFDDIMSIVEDIFNTITSVHGKPEYDKETGAPLNRAAELTDKAQSAHSKEFTDAYMRDYEKGKNIPRGEKGHRECSTHSSYVVRKNREKTKAQNNAPKYRDEYKDQVLKQKEEMRKKHAEISGGKKGTGGVPYLEFIEKLREISPLAGKSHRTKGNKGWK